MPDSGCKSTIVIISWHSPEVQFLQTSSVAKHSRESLLELGRTHRLWLGDRRDRGVQKKERTASFLESQN